MSSIESISAIAAVLVAGGRGYAMLPLPEIIGVVLSDDSVAAGVFLDVIEPELSQNAQIGKLGFEAKCAARQGVNAAGQDGMAPPLIQKVYEPSHHNDESSQRAPQRLFARVKGRLVTYRLSKV